MEANCALAATPYIASDKNIAPNIATQQFTY